MGVFLSCLHGAAQLRRPFRARGQAVVRGMRRRINAAASLRSHRDRPRRTCIGEANRPRARAGKVSRGRGAPADSRASRLAPEAVARCPWPAVALTWPAAARASPMQRRTLAGQHWHEAGRTDSRYRQPRCRAGIHRSKCRRRSPPASCRWRCRPPAMSCCRAGPPASRAPRLAITHRTAAPGMRSRRRRGGRGRFATGSWRGGLAPYDRELPTDDDRVPHQAAHRSIVIPSFFTPGIRFSFASDSRSRGMPNSRSSVVAISSASASSNWASWSSRIARTRATTLL